MIYIPKAANASFICRLLFLYKKMVMSGNNPSATVNINKSKLLPALKGVYSLMPSVSLVPLYIA